MSPNGGGDSTGTLAKAINRDFGSFSEFKKQFTARAGGHFGSGWVWLSVDPKNGNKLVITDGHDAFNPMRDGLRPVMCIDVWEHAYYIDQRNNRGAYIQVWWDCVNWDTANRAFASSSSKL